VSTNQVLKAHYRDGSKSATKMRTEGWVPGTVYGKGFEGINIMVPKIELAKFFHHSGKVFEVEVDGHGKHLVALDNVQRGHLGTDYIHFSFHKVAANKETTVTLPIHWTGTAVGTKEGGQVYPAIHEAHITGLPKDLPESIEIDVTELAMDSFWTWADVSAPKGCKWDHNMEDHIVSCHMPKVKAEPVEEETAAVVEPTAEGEAQVEEEKQAA
jgi:large subunit ribosomal protein L25